MAQVTLKASGLNTSANPLTLPEGTLVKASNVIIQSDNIIQSRRGYGLYGEAFGGINSRSSQLLAYKSRILNHYSSFIEYDDGAGNFTAFGGSFAAASPGLRIKSIEKNGNLYFTTADGIKKISAKIAEDLTDSAGFVSQAGAPKGLNLGASLNGSQGLITGFLPLDSACAYRMTWAIKDLNNNLIEGAPSDITQLYSPVEPFVVKDLYYLLGQLDQLTTGVLATGDYSISIRAINSTGTIEGVLQSTTDLTTLGDLYYYNANSLINKLETTANTFLASAKTTTRERTSQVAKLTFTTTISNYLKIGDTVVIAGLSDSSFNSATPVTLSSVTANTISYVNAGVDVAAVGDVNGYTVRQKYLNTTLIPVPVIPSVIPTHNDYVSLFTTINAILTELKLELTGMINASQLITFIRPIVQTTSSNASIQFNIPSDVTANWFYRIFRTDIKSATGTNVLSQNISPGDEMVLIYEGYPTAAELSARQVTFLDKTPSSANGVFTGSALYTNSTVEGIANANLAPPFALDINTFKGYTFYANTRSKHSKLINLLGVSEMVNQAFWGFPPVLSILDGIGVTKYKFYLGYQESARITFGATGAANTLPGSILGDTPAYVIFYSGNHTKYYVWFSKGFAITDPAISNAIGIKITVSSDTNGVVSQKMASAIAKYSDDFITFNGIDAGIAYTDIKNIKENNVKDISKSGNGLSVQALTQGVGQDNYGTIQTISTGATPTITCTGSHGLETGDSVAFTATNCTPSLDGTHVVTVINSTQFTVSQTVTGSGSAGYIHNETFRGVILSRDPSASVAVDETAKSLVEAINNDDNAIVWAYYITNEDKAPGTIQLEKRDLSTNPFYIMGNDNTTGLSFNPDITPEFSVTTASGSVTTITTPTAHTYGTYGQKVNIAISQCSGVFVDGVYTATITATNTLTIPITSTGGSGTAVIESLTNIATSENTEKANRIYYSKYNEPEHIPLANYVEVGSADKQILRIYPIRDSLFVFKEDGLFRISGESAPFNVALFDGSCKLSAPDSIGINSNQIFCFTTQGVQTVSESGVSFPLSRVIDNQVLKIQTYPNFKTATWGLGYPSDNSYLLFTCRNPTDSNATIAYRYCSLTATWTTFDKTDTCGIINTGDDTMYLGAGDINHIEKERKSFSRYDYTDREYSFLIGSASVHDNQIRLSTLTNIGIGDVLVQTQIITCYLLNAFLKRLDNEPVLTTSNFHDVFLAAAGNNMRKKLDDVIEAIAIDAGRLSVPSPTLASAYQQYKTNSSSYEISSIGEGSSPIITTTTPHGLTTGRIIEVSAATCTPTINGRQKVASVLDSTRFTINQTVTVGQGSPVLPATTVIYLNDDYEDIQASFNGVMTVLNNDPAISSSNYNPINYTTDFETIIESYDITNKSILTNLILPLLEGNITVYKGIKTEVQYAPITFGDPLSLKHLRECQILFANKNFTKATVSFSSDLVPGFQDNTFLGEGNGIFGHSPFGSTFFSGTASNTPHRTYITRDHQRCRFLNILFKHAIAREVWALYGVTIFSNDQAASPRAYRS